MIRLSYLVLPRLTAFDSPERFKGVLAYLHECGYEGVELNITEPFGIEPAVLEGMIEQFGLAIPSFLTGEAYADGLCLSSPDASVRRRTVERLIAYVSVASRFNAVLVVGLLQGLRRDEPNPNVANRRIAEGLKPVADAAGAKNVDLVIEPVNHLQVGFNNTVAEVQSLIAAIDSPAIRPMVDTIHLNIEERLADRSHPRLRQIAASRSLVRKQRRTVRHRTHRLHGRRPGTQADRLYRLRLGKSLPPIRP